MALISAATTGDLAQARKAVADGADLNAKDQHGRTPLHLAARCGHRDIAFFLLTAGADLESRSSRGSTPLHYACSNFSVDVALLLIEHHADANAVNEGRHRPLHNAVRHAEADRVVRALLAAGAYVNDVAPS